MSGIPFFKPAVLTLRSFPSVRLLAFGYFRYAPVAFGRLSSRIPELVVVQPGHPGNQVGVRVLEDEVIAAKRQRL